MKEKLLPIKLPPGLFKQGTQYQAKGRWYEADHVRFFESTIRPIGGYRRLLGFDGAPIGILTGCPRAMFAYRGNAGEVRVVIGTSSKLYLLTEGGLADVTFGGGSLTGSCSGDFADGSGAYGDGDYGAGPYGGFSIASTIIDATTWTLDSFGDYFVAVHTDDGRLFVWEGDPGTPAIAAPNAPTANLGVVVTPERFVVVLGADGNPRRIAWADQETYDTWIASSSNTAGDLEIATPGFLMTGKRTRNQTLLFTTTDLHTLTYIGGDEIYAVQEAGTKCGLVGANAVAMVDSRAYWMGWRSFFMFDGRVSKLPSEVADYVFGDFNYLQRALVTATTIAEFNEVWWYYPSSGSDENDRVVVFNYVEGHWSTHTLARAAGVDREVTPQPIMVGNHDTDGLTGYGYLFEHEVQHSGKDVVPYIKSGPYELGEGDQVMRVQSVVPDEKTAGQLELFIESAFGPNEPVAQTETVTLSGSAPQPARITGRQLEFTFTEDVEADWRLGNFRVGVRPQGTR